MGFGQRTVLIIFLFCLNIQTTSFLSGKVNAGSVGVVSATVTAERSTGDSSGLKTQTTDEQEISTKPKNILSLFKSRAEQFKYLFDLFVKEKQLPKQ